MNLTFEKILIIYMNKVTILFIKRLIIIKIHTDYTLKIL